MSTLVVEYFGEFEIIFADFLGARSRVGVASTYIYTYSIYQGSVTIIIKSASDIALCGVHGYL